MHSRLRSVRSVIATVLSEDAVRSLGGRSVGAADAFLTDFAARFGVHVDELWASTWARFGGGKDRRCHVWGKPTQDTPSAAISSILFSDSGLAVLGQLRPRCCALR